MKSRLVTVWFLAVFLIPQMLGAQERRTIPLDLYLIIDASEGFREARTETLAWINREVIDRLLQEGDRLIVWSAGRSASVIHSETVGGQKNAVKETLEKLEITGDSADFSGALREAASRSSREDPAGNRISYTLLVSGSAENLAPALGSSLSLFRWFRAEKYARWQALVVDPNILEKVRLSAAAYMSGL